MKNVRSTTNVIANASVDLLNHTLSPGLDSQSEDLIADDMNNKSVINYLVKEARLGHNMRLQCFNGPRGLKLRLEVLFHRKIQKKEQKLLCCTIYIQNRNEW